MKRLVSTLLLCVGVALSMMASPARDSRATTVGGSAASTLTDAAATANDSPSAMSFHQFMQQHNLTPGSNRLPNNAPQHVSAADMRGYRLVSMDTHMCFIGSNPVTNCPVLFILPRQVSEGGWTARLLPGDSDDHKIISGIYADFDVPVALDLENNTATLPMGMMVKQEMVDDTLKSVYIVPRNWFEEDSTDVITGTIYDDGSIYFEQGFLFVQEVAYSNYNDNGEYLNDTTEWQIVSRYLCHTYLLAPNGYHEYTKKTASSTGAVRSKGSDSDDDSDAGDDGGNDGTVIGKIHNNPGLMPGGNHGSHPRPPRPLKPGTVKGLQQVDGDDATNLGRLPHVIDSTKLIKESMTKIVRNWGGRDGDNTILPDGFGGGHARPPRTPSVPTGDGQDNSGDDCDLTNGNDNGADNESVTLGYCAHGSALTRDDRVFEPFGVGGNHPKKPGQKPSPDPNSRLLPDGPDPNPGNGGIWYCPKLSFSAFKNVLSSSTFTMSLIDLGGMLDPTGVGGNRPGPIKPFGPDDVCNKPAGFNPYSLGDRHTRLSSPKHSGSDDDALDNGTTIQSSFQPFDPGVGGVVKRPPVIIITLPDTAHFNPFDPLNPNLHTDDDPSVVITTAHEKKPVFLIQVEDTVYVYGLYGLGYVQNYMTINADGTMTFPKQKMGSSSDNMYNYTANSTVPSLNTRLRDLTAGNNGYWTLDLIYWGSTVLYPTYKNVRYYNNKLYFNNDNQFVLETGRAIRNISDVTRLINDILEGRSDANIKDVTDAINSLLQKK